MDKSRLDFDDHYVEKEGNTLTFGHTYFPDSLV